MQCAQWLHLGQVRGVAAMKRIAFLLKVRPEKLQEYKEYHKAVWPEMLDALRRNGWRNYTIFSTSEGQLFGYFVTPDSFQEALTRMEREEVNERWQTLMAPYFENMGGQHPDKSMVELEEIFHLD